MNNKDEFENLEENIDYDFLDVDEIKQQPYPKRLLKNIYK